ncbi:MAG: hypothetical protein AAFX50_10845, partial [Acidobacteriota bacterium]
MPPSPPAPAPAPPAAPNAEAPQAPSPAEITEALQKRVIGQHEALREMAISLSKKLAGLPVGNLLMIGSSGSGKTTL